jgi:GH35 family endo-1,4-beta-xylanase
MESTEGAIKFSVVDSLLEKMAGSSLLVKGHPLIWFHEGGIPEHLKNKSYANLRASCRGYILRCVGRYPELDSKTLLASCWPKTMGGTYDLLEA